MKLQCGNCQRTIEYSDEAPQFCSYCGHQLTETVYRDEQTVAHTPSQPPTITADQEVQEVVGGYRILNELGRGGMGVVFEAEEETTGRRIALKLLPRSLHRTEKTVQRFLREGQIAASLSHPRSTFIYAAGQDDGQFFIAMELMTGGTVREVVDQQGPLPIRKAVDFILDVIDGLAAAHAAGVIHRDVKPSNCFLTDDGRVKVGDYGISKSLFSDAALTQTGAFVGTPQFAAPEQIKAGTIDQRTDIYAVAATLFYLLTARAPFEGDAVQVVAAIASEPAPRVSTVRSDVPAELDLTIAQTLEKDPERRPQSLAELRLILLPFSSRGASIADLGRRMAAYFIDTTVAGVSAGLVTMGLLGAAIYTGLVYDQDELTIASPVLFVSLLLAYFLLAEVCWGRGLGKLLMGLRVVMDRDEPPKIGQALLRVLLIPGLFYTVAQIGPAVVVTLSKMDTDRLATEDTVRITFAKLISIGVGWVITLPLFSTMRRENGYRGVHELVSKTRVVRLRPPIESRIAQPIPISLPCVLPSPQKIGPYQVTGEIGSYDTSTIYQAHDEQLGRPIWLVVDREGTQEPSAARMGVTRPARQHWLHGESASDGRWDALEAISGVPLVELVRSPARLPWAQARTLLGDLAEELAAGLDDGTLPSELSLAQVWVDRNGRLKLLDTPLASPSDAERVELLPGSAEERAVTLLKTVGEIFRTDELPGHAQDLFDQLAARTPSRATLLCAAEELQKMVDRPSRLGWDDRFGQVAVSFGTEVMMYWAFILLTSLSLALQTDLSIGIRWGIITPLSFILVAALGYWFRGGPVLRFAGVQVRRAGGELATRSRCAWRNLVAWAPAIVAWSILGPLVSDLMVTNPEFSLSYKLAGGVAILMLCLISGGAVYAVLRPTRGLQDLLSKTHLVLR